MKLFISILAASLIIFSSCKVVDSETYLDVLKNKGEDPIKFVNAQLEAHDLLIFDDALHSAYEPFIFYQDLIQNKEFTSKVKYIFIESFDITSQDGIDKYLQSPDKDITLLYEAFQSDFTGNGWRYETYLDLLNTIWKVNRELEENDRLKVICCDQPIYWEAIHTRKDYDTFQESLTGRDYFMYKIIMKTLGSFQNGEKGIFLTNTRHAYKTIKKSDGSPHWNCGTFFHQWHTGKTYSIRIHNATLEIKKRLDNIENKSTQGLDEVEYGFIRMENGKWDDAFAQNGNIPVAIPFENNVFGKTKYVGNLMLNSQEGQTMYDAYDALIFLAPLDQLHFSAKTNFYITEPFKKELERRILLLNDNDTASLFQNYGVESMQKFIELTLQASPRTRNTLIN